MLTPSCGVSASRRSRFLLAITSIGSSSRMPGVAEILATPAKSCVLNSASLTNFVPANIPTNSA